MELLIIIYCFNLKLFHYFLTQRQDFCWNSNPPNHIYHIEVLLPCIVFLQIELITYK